MASLPAYIIQDDDDLDATMDNLSLEEKEEEEKEKEVVMVNATNRDTENLAIQEDSTMDNTMQQACENSVRAFHASLPKKVSPIRLQWQPYSRCYFQEKAC